MDGSKESGSKVRKLGVGFTRRVFVRRFPKVLEIRRGNVEELEDDVDDLRLASPRFDKGQTNTVYTSIIVTVLVRRIKDGLGDEFSLPAGAHCRETDVPERYHLLQIRYLACSSAFHPAFFWCHL